MHSLSRFIPGEEIDAVSRWQFGDVDEDLLQRQAQAQARLLAQAQAEQAERDARREQEVHQQGYAEGFEQGRAAAMLEAQRQHQQYVEQQGLASARQFGRLLAAAREQLTLSEQVMAHGVLELACTLARQVLRHELTVNPNALQPVIREGLQMLADDSKAALVRLHPLDLEVLHDVLQDEFAALSLTLVADATIEQGGCRITSAGAVIDAELPSRWRRAIARLGLQVQWDE